MSSLLSGQVIAHLGQGIAVEIDGNLVLCQTLRKLDTVAVGDNVLCSLSDTEQGRIESILPRRSVLLRPSRNAKTRPVAANIDFIYVVLAVEPACDFLLLDQYLAICETHRIAAKLVLNKCDLPPPAAMIEELALYQGLGYELHRVSVTNQQGLADLQQALHDQVSIFVGQSGVGKSSLTNTLIPDKAIKTNSISTTTKHGRHTTTTATLYHLPNGGDLIDSPGVAIFGLADLTEQQLSYGFREFQPLLDHCRFHNCRHVKDAGCAVRAAAENGSIAMSRYQRFLKLREKMPTA